MGHLRSLAMGSALTWALFAAGCSCGESDTNANQTAGSGGAGASGASGSGGDLFSGAGGNNGSGGASSGAGGGGGGDSTCIYLPTPGQFNPQMDCSWGGPPAGDLYPEWDDVVMTPVVVNLTDDNGDSNVDLDDIPDIAFVSYVLNGTCPAGITCGCCNSDGVLRIVSGGCNADGSMQQHLSIGATEIQADIGVAGVWLDSSGGLAAGDIDADGSVDLVATVNGGGTIAFERDGTVKWYQPNLPSGLDHLAGTTPSLADLDKDGKPEVIQGRVVLNGEDGSLEWSGAASLGSNGFMGPVSSTGDVNLDGFNEVLAGNTLYDHQGNELWTYTFGTASNTTDCGGGANYPCTGFTATGNFDGDDHGEIVIVRMGELFILDHTGTPVQAFGVPAIIPIPVAGCTRNEGGPPTVADFDGDGKAEVGVAGANFYIVADLECLETPLPSQCSDPGIRWKVANADCSSRVTGSSVFDFDGDGQAEVVYNDETTFRILKGSDGTVLESFPNTSHTRLEMPIVADVDNDGNAEIVFIENGAGAQAIQVWGDATDSWVPTRRIWNQHAYHVTNVTELGQIPADESENWLQATSATPSGLMNNFRQNLPDFDVFSAPDLTVELSVDKSACPAVLKLQAKVCNEGALQVGPGAPVSFWDNGTQTEILCNNAPGTTPLTTSNSLSPGACETVTCEWVGAPASPNTVDVRACVDNAGYDCDTDQAGGNGECHEDNNVGDGIGVGCEGVN